MNKSKSVHVNKSNKNVEDLDNLSKEELIARIKSIHAHNVQLQNIITKSLNNDNVRQTMKNKRDFNFDRCYKRHILLKLFYLGWDYQGYATQENTNDTIEYHLFNALQKTCLIEDRTTSNYHRCGRTDKGVSSFGQVISITVRSKLDETDQQRLNDELRYCKILNRVLPDEIRCVAWKPAPDMFSARFDCVNRTYKYFFPLGNLNIENMRKGSGYFSGTHDFRNFCKMDVGNGVTEFIRHIDDITIEPSNCEQNSEEYDVFILTIKSKGFLWHQIRCILGILFLIGQDKESPELIQELLDVDKHPCKPDYSMANEIPLNLYSCNHELETDWQIDDEDLQIVVEELRKSWSFNIIKSTMIKSMMNDLLKDITSPNLKCLSENLIQGVKPKHYIPVLKRQKCDSLEKKIDHYVKRSRLIIEENNT